MPILQEDMIRILNIAKEFYLYNNESKSVAQRTKQEIEHLVRETLQQAEITPQVRALITNITRPILALINHIVETSPTDSDLMFLGAKLQHFRDVSKRNEYSRNYMRRKRNTEPSQSPSRALASGISSTNQDLADWKKAKQNPGNWQPTFPSTNDHSLTRASETSLNLPNQDHEDEREKLITERDHNALITGEDLPKT